MSEGLTMAGEAFRLGMLNNKTGPYYGRRKPDVVAAWVAGRFFRSLMTEDQICEAELWSDEDISGTDGE